MTTLSRQDLFDKVWSQPVTKVAAELGLSDTAVRKMCDRHDIPVPSRGYWAQVAAGKTFPRPHLRPAKNASLESITFVGAAQPSPEIKAAAERIKAKAVRPRSPAEECRAMDAAVVEPTPAGDDDIHPLAVRTRDKLAGSKAGELARVSGKGLFTVAGAADQAGRIAEILTLLLRAMEARGTVAVAGSSWRSSQTFLKLALISRFWWRWAMLFRRRSKAKSGSAMISIITSL